MKVTHLTYNICILNVLLDKCFLLLNYLMLREASIKETWNFSFCFFQLRILQCKISATSLRFPYMVKTFELTMIATLLGTDSCKPTILSMEMVDTAPIILAYWINP